MKMELEIELHESTNGFLEKLEFLRAMKLKHEKKAKESGKVV